MTEADEFGWPPTPHTKEGIRLHADYYADEVGNSIGERIAAVERDAAGQVTLAAGRLERLAKCQKIRPFQAGDEELVCAHDMIGLLPTVHGYVHNPVEIRRLREAETGWPR